MAGERADLRHVTLKIVFSSMCMFAQGQKLDISVAYPLRFRIDLPLCYFPGEMLGTGSLVQVFKKSIGTAQGSSATERNMGGCQFLAPAFLVNSRLETQW